MSHVLSVMLNLDLCASHGSFRAGDVHTGDMEGTVGLTIEGPSPPETPTPTIGMKE